MIDELIRYLGINLPSDTVVIVASLLIVGGFLLLIWWLVPLLKHYLAARHILAHVKKLGNKTLSNIRVPDGVDGELFIEHLVLSGDKIIVVDVKRYDGLIYGSESLDTWTQVVNRRNFQFTNPLLQMKNYIIAVQSIVPDLDVEGAVLFAGRSYFPKRIPEGVLTLEDIPKQPRKKAVSEHALSNWRQLQTYQQRTT